MEHDTNANVWLWSVEAVTAIMAELQRQLEGPVGVAAGRRAPIMDPQPRQSGAWSPTPPVRHPRGNRPRLQNHFTDLVAHNNGRAPYTTRIPGSGRAQLEGRVPGDWPQAMADHQRLREAEGAAAGGGRSRISIYEGAKTPDYWRDRSAAAMDVTELIRVLSRSVLAAAHHDVGWANRLGLGDLNSARALLLPRGEGGAELVLMCKHPCASAAAGVMDADRRMLLPFGVVEVLAGTAALVLPGRAADGCFPSPDTMPSFFRPSCAPPPRRGGNGGCCRGCQFRLNVEAAEAVCMEAEAEEGGELLVGEPLGRGPRYGRCNAAGLLGLTRSQRARLHRACLVGHYTATQLDFVRWTGALPCSDIQLHGLRVDAMRSCGS